MHILITIDHPIDTACALVIIFWLALVIQRLYFHPLSCFPGPPLAAITGFYRTYFEVIKGGEFLREIQNLHSLYGPVVRIGPNELHFNDYSAHAEIYSVGSQLTKDPSFYRCFGVDGSAFGAVNPCVSKIRRAFMNNFFSRRAMLQLEDMIRQKAVHLVSRLSNSKQPNNMFLAFRSATLDIITVHMFGHCVDALDHPDFCAPLLLDIQTAIPLLWTIKSFPWIATLYLFLPKGVGLHLHEQFRAFLNVRQTLIRWLNRSQSEAEAHPFLHDQSICHQIFNPFNKPCHAYPSMQPVFDEILSLIQAGSDTVGNTCTVGTFHVLNNDAVRLALVEELKANWPNDEDPIDLSVLQDLPYLTAVVKESLRLSHGFVSPLPRIVGPMGAYIAGHYIPPKTTVGISVTFVHLNPILFPNPTQFMPERWLQPSSTSLNKYLLSFSSGPRMCLGISMAWAELYMFFAYIFRKMDMRIVEFDISDFNDFKDYFVPIYGGGQLHVIRAEYA
ncbi:hypothetical protein D9613_005506 [Agrocybe pediades]|uniref:Cytochrome P450 n=1 Tax=Agrocybe pediades TaxID=84607 RepID=A0A8H4QYL4_9AGAR|nr:hypothetical protein D9613_005506 [Agrocybe pediades]